MIFKFKNTVLLILAFILSASNMNYKAQTDNLFKNSDELISKVQYRANDLFDELKTLDFYNSKKENKSRSSSSNVNMLSSNSLNNNSNDDAIDFDLCEDEIHYLYNSLDDESKNTIVEHLEDIPILEFFYKLGTGEDFDFIEFINNNPELCEGVIEYCKIVGEKENNDESETSSKEDDFVSRSPLKITEAALLSYGISEWLIASLLTATGTAASSIWIPFVGWIIAAAAIVTLTVIIACNWDTISQGYNVLIDFLCERYPAISSLIISASNDAYAEALNNFTNASYERTTQALAKEGLYYRSKEEMDNDLSLALKIGKISTTIDIVNNFFNKKRPNVYLGKMESNYNTIASDDIDGIYFYAEQDAWKTLLSRYKNDIWPLNLYFIDLMVSLDSIFYLCSAPESYFRSQDKVIVRRGPTGLEFIYLQVERIDNSSYAKELEAIYNWGYRWYSNIPIVKADHY